MSWPTCPRCSMGIDSDRDGNCSVCARWTDAEALAASNAYQLSITATQQFFKLMQLLKPEWTKP